MKNSIKYCTAAICIILLSILIFLAVFMYFPEKSFVPDQIKAGASLPPFVSSDDPNQTQYTGWDPSATPGSFAGGSGTENDPYLISNAEQLVLMGSTLYLDGGYFFALVQDIDLTDWIALNSATDGWAPLGDDSQPFVGHFDGNYHTISGLWTNYTSGSDFYIGLFGAAQEASFTNLHIETSAAGVTGEQYVGLLAGQTLNSTIDNISFEGSVSGRNEVGGLVGVTDHGVSNARGRIEIESRTAVGGLVGTVEGSDNTFENCHLDVTMSVDFEFVSDIQRYAGGLVGKLSEKSFVTDCSVYIDASIEIRNISSSSKQYFTGGLVGTTGAGCVFDGNRVSGSIVSPRRIQYVGGMVGHAQFRNSEPYDYCIIQNFEVDIMITIGSVNANESCHYIGGVVGLVYDTTVQNGTVKAKLEVERGYSTGGIVGSAIRSSFYNIEVQSALVSHSSTGGAAGSATNSTFSKINVAATVDATGREIGGVVGSASGTSKFDEVTVRGTVSALDTWIGGFGGQLYADVSDCQIFVDVEGDSYVGGLAGSFGGTVKNTHATGIIKADTSAAGFIAHSSNLTAENCSSAGSVIAKIPSAGGFATGIIGQSVFKNCFSSADVTITETTGGSSAIGGFIGKINNFLTIEDCFSTGNVYNLVDNNIYYGTSSAGAFIGEIELTTNSSQPNAYITPPEMFITRCYALGEVQTAGVIMGGFIGRINISSATATASIIKIEQCFYSGLLTSAESINSRSNSLYIGGLVGTATPSKGGIIFSNVYANAFISVPAATSLTHIGGLAGYVSGSSIQFENAYFAGVIEESGDTGSVGAVIGQRASAAAASFDSVFYDSSLFEGQAIGSQGGDIVGITGESSQNMQDKAIFLAEGWDPSIWNLGENTYPYFAWFQPENFGLLHLSYVYEQTTRFVEYTHPLALELSIELWGNTPVVELFGYLSDHAIIAGQNPRTVTLLEFDQTLEISLPVLTLGSGLTTYQLSITLRHPADALSIVPDAASAQNLDGTMWDFSKSSDMSDPIVLSAVFTDVLTQPDLSGLEFYWIISAQIVGNGTNYLFNGASLPLQVYEILLMVKDPFGNEATASLTLNLVDKTELKKLTQNAKGYLTDPSYTLGSIKKLGLAIDSAEVSLAENTATQTHLDAQYAMLEDALKGLIDLRELRAAIKLAKEVEEGRYSASTYGELLQALQKAEDVEIEPNSSALDVSTALVRLRAAYAALRNDRSALEQAVTAASLLNPNGFVEGKWIEFNTVYAEANAVLIDLSAYQSVIDDAATKMNAQILRVTVNTAALQALAVQAGFLQQQDYTAESWSIFAAALSQATSVLEKDIYLQAVIDDSANRLSAAMKNLVLAEQPQNQTIFSDQLLSILVSAGLVLVVAALLGVFLRYIFKTKK